MDLYRQAVRLAKDPKHTKWLSPLLLTADAALCALIIWKVPYTEIDWKAYMQQVQQYHDGERDYTLIKGDTGPLVYPASHVYIYSVLHSVTDGGKNVLMAQVIFAGVYMAVLNLVMACYRQAKVPPYVFPLLVLSKRMHSLFVLRLFNDCFAVGGLFLAIYAYQRRIWTIGSLAYSLAVATKMSVLLAAPGVGVILLQALPTRRAINAAFLMANLQFTMALPFLPSNATGYVSRAFQFTRQFLFKWTVNWRFMGEETFLAREFAAALVLCNFAGLLLFLSTRWTRPTGLSLPQLAKTMFQPLPPLVQQQLSLNVNPDFVMTTILSSTMIGLLCARSLHYQFYAYIAWASPFLLWKSGLQPVLIYLIWAAQEWAWNVYPSTNVSSLVVVGCLTVQVFGVWWGTSDDFTDVQILKPQSGNPAGKADAKLGPSDVKNKDS